MKLSIKVVPGSSQSVISGWLGEALRIRVAAPAERGKANAAVEKVIVQALNLPKGSAKIISGKTSARKILEIDGFSEAEIHKRIKELV